MSDLYIYSIRKTIFSFIHFTILSQVEAVDTLCLDDDVTNEERSLKLKEIETPQFVVDQLYQITKDVTDVLKDHDIPFMASFGTILPLIAKIPENYMIA